MPFSEFTALRSRVGCLAIREEAANGQNTLLAAQPYICARAMDSTISDTARSQAARIRWPSRGALSQIWARCYGGTNATPPHLDGDSTAVALRDYPQADHNCLLRGTGTSGATAGDLDMLRDISSVPAPRRPENINEF